MISVEAPRSVHRTLITLPTEEKQGACGHLVCLRACPPLRREHDASFHVGDASEVTEHLCSHTGRSHTPEMAGQQGPPAWVLRPHSPPRARPGPPSPARGCSQTSSPDPTSWKAKLSCLGFWIKYSDLLGRLDVKLLHKLRLPASREAGNTSSQLAHVPVGEEVP